ncbi:MAG: TolC family protein [Bacteroidales bacterium]
MRSLDYFLETGLRNSPLLNDLQNQLNTTAIDSLIIKADRKPKIEARSGLLYAPYNKNFGYDEVITDGGNYQAIGFVSQDIFTSKKVDNKYQSVANLKTGLGIDKKITEAEFRRSITSLYLDSYSVFSDLTFNRSFFTLMNEQDRINQGFVKAGIITRSEYLAALIETREQEIIVDRLNNLYMKSIRLLNEICGLKDSSYFELLAPGIALSGQDKPSDYLLLKQFYADSLKLENDRDALNLKYKPSVNWFADAGIMTSNPFNFYNHFGLSAGISLSFPLYDGHQKVLEEKKLTISENTRSFYSSSYRKQYDQKYTGLEKELEGVREVRTKIESQLKTADELVKSLKLQLETGLIRMNDYLTALKNYRNISHNLSVADIEIYRLINEMNYFLAK